MRLRFIRPLPWLVSFALVSAVIISAAAPGLALAGSTFESLDGNLVVNTAGNTDWATAPNLAVGIDQSQTNSDNSYTGGAKHDDVCPSSSTGSIPPNKDDLMRFYVANETAGDDIFLYLAWERFLSKESSASAHMGFEFNQSETPCPAGSANVLRTAGDLLILYDLEGGGSPVLTLMRWLTALGPGNTCAAKQSAPCWGNAVNLTAAGFADGSINTTAPITDPISGQVLNFTNQFGEAAINLTDSGVFQAGVCTAFGSAMLGSRSSGNSFTSALKDFVGPTPIDVQNCGQIIIEKQTNPDGASGNFGFSTTGGLSPATFNLSDNGVRDYGANIQAGTYTVTESTIPSNFALQSITCTVTGSGGSGSTVSLGTATVSIDLQPTDTVRCVVTNRQLTGAIAITKTAKHADQSGATSANLVAGFRITDASGGTHNVTTDANGLACVQGLPLGNASVVETTPPAGYAGDPDTEMVTVVDGTCSSGAVGVSFENTPLTDVTVTVDSQHDGATSTTITCVDANGDTLDSVTVSDGSLNLTDLPPGVVTCTIDVDP